MAKKRQESVGNGTLSARQEKALAALLVAPTHQVAAEQAGISPRTLRDYLRQPAFHQEYLARRRQIVSAAVSLAQQRAPAAVAVLCSIMSDSGNPPTARLAAAGKVLDMALRGVEIEDMAQQVAELQEEIDSLKTLVQLLPRPPLEQPTNGNSRRSYAR
jgi:hypothetical protein